MKTIEAQACETSFDAVRRARSEGADFVYFNDIEIPVSDRAVVAFAFSNRKPSVKPQDDQVRRVMVLMLEVIKRHIESPGSFDLLELVKKMAEVAS